MKHLAIAFVEVHVSLFSDSMIEQLSPYFSNNKVPVLKHNDLEVWDSLAIIEYVSAYCQQEATNTLMAKAIGYLEVLVWQTQCLHQWCFDSRATKYHCGQ